MIPCCCGSAAFCYKCWILNSCHCGRDVMSTYFELLGMLDEADGVVSAGT